VKDVASFRAGVLAITGVKTDGSALGVLTAWKDSHETVVKLTARVEELEQEKLKREFELLLDEAGGKDAKLPPSKREEITQIALKSANGKFTAGAIETARAFLSMRGPLVDNTGTKKPETKAGEGEMHPLHLEIRRTLGRDDTPVKQ
jgi:hypothetical protein